VEEALIVALPMAISLHKATPMDSQATLPLRLRPFPREAATTLSTAGVVSVTEARAPTLFLSITAVAHTLAIL
jgi:hypothetical protein